MLFRLLAGLLGPLCALVLAGPLPAPGTPGATPGARPVANPWPYPKACLETELIRFEVWRNAVDHTQHLELRGVSRPCAGKAQQGVRLALTQYRAVGNTFVGWMGAPWRTNSIGDLKFGRSGTLPGDTILCLSTGLSRRPGGLYAQHNRCFREKWSSPKQTHGADLTDVPINDKRVSVPLERVPKPGTSSPAGCWNCLITSATKPMPVPKPMAAPGTVVPQCTRLKIDEAIIERRAAIQLNGEVRSCVPGHTDELYLANVFYGSAGGRLGRRWTITDPDDEKFIQYTGLSDNEDAFCISSGRFQTNDGSYAVHLICYAVRPDAAGKLELVQISTRDPRVRKPVDTFDEGDPGGTCATCL